MQLPAQRIFIAHHLALAHTAVWFPVATLQMHAAATHVGWPILGRNSYS